MANRIQIRRDTAANWTSENPTLASGEPALETDTSKQKIGDGVTAWVDLDYISSEAANGIPSGGTTGQVLKKLSDTDYDADWQNESGGSASFINPLDYTGTDTEKIQAAIDEASSTQSIMIIPQKNGSNDFWEIEEALLLKSNTTILFQGKPRLKRADTCRDNIFRTENCGLGITAPFDIVDNVQLIGKWECHGADNPRSSGDASKTLSTGDTTIFGVSYGTDAGVGGQTQTGDWRDYFIIFAYATNYIVDGAEFYNSQSYCITNERCNYFKLQNIYADLPLARTYDGNPEEVKNTNIIDIRMGCRYWEVENISGLSDDDPVALVLIDLGQSAGVYGNYQVTGNIYSGASDNIEHGVLRNIKCETNHQLVRLLNEPNTLINDITIDNITDTGQNPNIILKLGDDQPLYGGANNLGDLKNLTISNITNNAATKCIVVEGSVSESVIENVRDFTGAEPVSFSGTNKGCRNLVLKNIWRFGNYTILSEVWNSDGTTLKRHGMYLNDLYETYLIDSDRSIDGKLFANKDNTPDNTKEIWTGTAAEFALITRQPNLIYFIKGTNEVYVGDGAGSGVTSLYDDDFTGTSISEDYTVTNPSTASIEYSQDDELRVAIKSAGGNTTFGNDFIRKTTGWEPDAQTIFMTIDVTNPTPHDQDVWQFGLSDVSTINNRVVVSRNITSGKISCVIVEGGSTVLNFAFDLDITSTKRLGILIDSSDAYFYYWNGSAYSLITSNAITTATDTYSPFWLNAKVGTASTDTIVYDRLTIADGFHGSSERP